MLGLAVQVSGALDALKLVVVWLLILLAASSATQMIGAVAYREDDRP